MVYTGGYYSCPNLHRSRGGPAIIHDPVLPLPCINGVFYTKEQIEKMEEIRTRILNRKVKRCARYWYNKTYMNPESEAFKRRMKRDIDVLETR